MEGALLRIHMIALVPEVLMLSRTGSEDGTAVTELLQESKASQLV